MPTNEEIFAGPNPELRLDNLIQVAKTNRNVDIVRLFNAQHPDVRDQIHISTIGARICRGLNEIAHRDGRSRAELKADLEAERARNGVAGRNQHTNVTEPGAAEETESDDDGEMEDTETSCTPAAQPTTPHPAEKAKSNDSDSAPSPVPGRETRARTATRQKTLGFGAQRQDSTASSSDDSSPLAKKSKPTVSSSSPQSSSAGNKRKYAEGYEVAGAGTQENDEPRKKAKKTGHGTGAVSAAQRSFKASSGRSAVSRSHKGSGVVGKDSQAFSSRSDLRLRLGRSSAAAKPQGSRTDSSNGNSSRATEAGEELRQRLKAAETDAVFSGEAWIDDDVVLERASEQTIPEIVQTANRAARFNRHNAEGVRRRISLALDNRATRRGRRRSLVEMELNRKRVENDIQAGGMSKWR